MMDLLAVLVLLTLAPTITIYIIRKRREATLLFIDAKSLITIAINVGTTAKLTIS